MALLRKYEVDGFDPNAHLIKIQNKDEDGNVTEALWMPAQPSMDWFLSVFPEGGFTHSILENNNQRVVVKAQVYRNVNDTRAASEATVVKFAGDDEHGKNYVQNAVTAAIRKALGYLGFGTPLYAEEYEGIPTSNTPLPEQADAGFILSSGMTAPMPDIPGLTTATAEQTVPPVAEEKKKPGRKKKEDVQPDAAPEVVEAKPEITPPPVPMEIMKPAEEKEEPVAEEMVPEVAEEKTSFGKTIPNTPEEAGNVIVPIGKAKGMTIADAVKEHGEGVIQFVVDKAKGKPEYAEFVAAGAIFFGSEG